MARRVGGSDLHELLMTQRRILTRRQVLIAGIGLGASALLAACGGDDDDSPTATTAPATQPAAEPTATTAAAEPTVTGAAAETPGGSAGSDRVSFPVTVEHDMGETVVPALPERIVATYDTEPLDVLVAVGLKPVFVNITGTYDVPISPWISEADLDGVETVDGVEVLDIERIVAARPDLILDVWADDETYPLLSGAAPTIVLKAAETTTWQMSQRRAGLATDTVQKSEDAIAETERVLDEQAERLASYSDRSVTIAYQWNEGINVHGGDIVIGTILTRMGVTVDAPDPADVTVLSLERWGDLADTDILLSLTFIADDMMQQESAPLFQTLPAVTEGRYMVLDSRIARAMYLESTLSVRWAAPLIADAIIEAAEGRGRELT